MRVLHYVEAFSLLTETFFYEEFTAQRAVGLDVKVLTHRRVDEEGRPFPAVRVVPRAPRLSAEALAGQLRRLLTLDPDWGSSTARILRALREERGDLVHAHYGWGGLSVLGAARAAGLPLVVTFQGNDVRPQAPFPSSLQRPRLFAYASRILVLSSRMADRLAGQGAERSKIVVHPNGLRIASFPCRARPLPPGEAVRIVSVGRLVEKKGMDVLLSAVGEVAAAGRKVRVSILGGGPEEDRLRRMASELPPAAQVEIAGALPREQVLARMQEADIFVLASRTARDGDAEGIPTAILEAEALGLPVVSTLHEGIPEALPPENRGFLAPEGDAGALAARLRAMIAARENWADISRRGRAWVEKEFDSGVLAEKARGIYSSVLAG